VECDADQTAYCIVDEYGRTTSGCLSMVARWSGRGQLPDVVVKEVGDEIRRVIQDVDGALEGRIPKDVAPGKNLEFEFFDTMGRRYRATVSLPEARQNSSPPAQQGQ
jgi:hypothetical protein